MAGSGKIDLDVLRDAITSATGDVESKIAEMKSVQSPDIGSMFDMQRAMTKLSQISELSSSVVSSQNSSLMSMARNTKG